MLQRVFVCGGLLAAWVWCAPCLAQDRSSLSVLVMDPLAAPLSCPCVKGVAQRQYDKLGEFLQKRLDRPVKVLFSDDLAKGFRAADGRIDVIIGKRSVVPFGARINRLAVRPALMLTGKDGKTTLTGLFVVRSGDPAREPKDLAGHTILFGPPDCDEKFRAAAEALNKAGVAVAGKLETRPGCSDAVLEMLEHPAHPTAAVISSYAAALLEGCGTVPKGAIRIIGSTEPVPFVTVFFTSSVDESLAGKIRAALATVKEEPELLKAIESAVGFVPVEDSAKAAAKPEPAPAKTADPSGAEAAWPGWRGPNRDGVVARLPDRLPADAKIVWSCDLTGRGLAGIAATASRVIVADRGLTDQSDLFRCLDVRTGKEVWRLEYLTAGKIKDYGNSPRATPLICGDKVYTLGGLGDLHCVRLSDGIVLWSKNLARDFGAAVPTWGYCSSPLAVDGKLIVNPGAKGASLVALDCESGKEVWHCPGLPPAYASFIAGTFGGVRQVVGCDEQTVGGWDLATGQRLWTLVPPVRGDFNVPTPIDAGGKLILASENNGTRLYEFGAAGAIKTVPVAANPDLAPDSSTPVLIADRLVGCWNALYCLDVDRGLKPVWTGEDVVFANYASLVASADRALVITNDGELLLVDAASPSFRIISRLRVFPKGSAVLSHPALVGSRLYLRDLSRVVCVDLSE